MSGRAALKDLQDHKHRNPALSVIRVRESGRSHERRVYLDHCLVRRRKPHLCEPKVLKVRNRFFKVLPPAQVGVFAIPREELDLSKV